ncbi:MAG: hypothetical protein RIK85_02150 [Marinobacter sp.]
MTSKLSLKFLLVLLLAAVGVLVYSLIPRAIELKVSDDGNFLFYNNPVALKYDNGFIVAYLTSRGKVKLDIWSDENKVKSHTIHNFRDQIDRKRGWADDHAAPAIFHDENRHVLYLATAYHGTNLFIYEYSLKSGEIKQILVAKGRYTYPRFFKGNQENIGLLVRQQPEVGLRGDLIMRSSSDGFMSESIVVPSEEGTVVYAGTPVSNEKSLYFSYSVHHYSENRLIGFQLVKFDLESKELVESCDISSNLRSDYISNRPTGLGLDDGYLMVGSALTYTSDSGLESVESSGKGKGQRGIELQSVLLVRGRVEDCNSFDVVFEKSQVNKPYYHTSVAINNSGNYLFFDDDNVMTNWSHRNCFRNEKMMYPNFIEDSVVLYASKNEEYSIRNFNSSLYACIRQ